MESSLDYELPCQAVVRKIDDMYSVEAYPIVEINGNRESIFMCLQFQLVDGKPMNITPDPTEWNRRLGIRCQESHE